MPYEDLVAQFLARGGKVQKVDEGKTALGLSDSQWRREVSKPGTIQARAREAELDRANALEAKWHQAHDAHFVGDHEEGHRIMDEE